MFEFDYCATLDGGALNNGSADSAGYGPYCLEARTGQKRMVRLDFGRGVTNNEAEYRSLLAALKDLVGRIQRAGKSPSDQRLLVHTDSKLVVGQLTQGWQVKAANPSTSSGQALRPPVDEAALVMQTFGRCEPSTSLRTGLVKVPRDDVPSAGPGA